MQEHNVWSLFKIASEFERKLSYSCCKEEDFSYDLDSRATENRFFAGPDRFLVCKTDSVCIKRIFFRSEKKHTLRSYTGPITWISQVSNR